MQKITLLDKHYKEEQLGTFQDDVNECLDPRFNDKAKEFEEKCEVPRDDCFRKADFHVTVEVEFPQKKEFDEFQK